MVFYVFHNITMTSRNSLCMCLHVRPKTILNRLSFYTCNVFTRRFAFSRRWKTLSSQGCSVSERVVKPNMCTSRVLNCKDFKGREHPFQLMNIPQVCSIDFKHAIENWKSVLRIISKYDLEFRPKSFLDGAGQAIVQVSKCIAEGNFKALDEMVTSKAIREVKANYENFSSEQKNLIAVHRSDILKQFVYEVKVKESHLCKEPWVKGLPEIIPATKVEILVVLECCRSKTLEIGEEIQREITFFCNYRFERSFDSEVRQSGWIISQLNHFIP